MRVCLAILFVAACGDNIQLSIDGGPDAPAGFVEAAHDGVPVVMTGGGAVLARPHVQPIFFANDTAIQTQVEMFLAQLGPSPYWSATTSEYGVGAITVLPTIVSTDTPPANDQDLATWLTANTDGTHTADGWPAAVDPNTIYATFLPAGVAFTGACTSFGGYHDEDTSTTNVEFPYALLPRCGGSTNMGTNILAQLTAATSHELVEASTDPFPQSTPAYTEIDTDHFIWGRTPGAELGDMCEYVETADQQLVGSYYVQRTWSNASAAAGHDPCVPAMAGPYVAAAPVLTEDIMVSTHGGMLMTKGIALPVGTSKTLEIDMFSDAPADDWNVQAYDSATLLGTGTPTLAFQWDKATGHNGDKFQLMVTRTKAPTGSRGSEIAITATVGNKIVAMWWAYVAAM